MVMVTEKLLLTLVSLLEKFHGVVDQDCKSSEDQTTCFRWQQKITNITYLIV